MEQPLEPERRRRRRKYTPTPAQKASVEAFKVMMAVGVSVILTFLMLWWILQWR